MAITDLTNTAWTFNNTIDVGAENNSYHITFTSNGEDFTGVRRYGLDQAYPNELWFLYSVGGGVTGNKYVYEDGWSMPQYKTIYISGGTDATNSTLISWIEANATQYIEPHDIIISYNGNTITMDDSGTEVLDTKGHWLPDDITVEYTKTLGSATTPTTTITANPTISVGSTGLITASVSGTQSVTPTVSAGYVSTGTAGTITVSGSNTSQLTVYNGAKHAVSLISSFIIVYPYLSSSSRNYAYQFEQEMSWAQWCASAYNKDGFYIQGSYVYEEYGNYYVLNASPSSVIENEAIYSLTTTQ